MTRSLIHTSSVRQGKHEATRHSHLLILPHPPRGMEAQDHPLVGDTTDNRQLDDVPKRRMHEKLTRSIKAVYGTLCLLSESLSYS